MIRISFKNFERDFRNCYDIKDNFQIKDKEDMLRIINDLYGAEEYTIDYNDKNILLK